MGRLVPALLGEHPAYFVDPLEVVTAEAVWTVADFRFGLELVQVPYPAAHAWPDYRAAACRAGW